MRLRDSRLGRAWIAIREDETAAAAMGVPLMRTKTWAYATGAFFGGVAGAYYASYKSATFPDDFFFNISVFILCMVILGGMGNIWGVIVGAALPRLPRPGGPREHRRAGSTSTSARSIDVPKYEFGIFGDHPRRRDALPAGGPDPEHDDARPSCTRASHDEPLYDVAHESSRDDSADAA